MHTHTHIQIPLNFLWYLSGVIKERNQELKLLKIMACMENVCMETFHHIYESYISIITYVHMYICVYIQICAFESIYCWVIPSTGHVMRRSRFELLLMFNVCQLFLDSSWHKSLTSLVLAFCTRLEPVCIQLSCIRTDRETDTVK